MTELDRKQWSELLGRLDDPKTHGEIVEVVEGEDAIDAIDADAQQLVDDAIEAGDLVENPEAGMFGAIELPEEDEATNGNAETPKSANSTSEEDGSTRSNPGVNTAETPEQNVESDDYHVEIDEDVVADHYQRVRGVYERLATVGEYHTMGLDDLAGWYITRDEIDVGPLKEGWTKRRRPASFEKDLDTVLGRVDRTIYGLTTYKSRDAIGRWTSARLNESNQYEYADGETPTPNVEDLRAVTVWGDIDLRDELKGKRGDLDDETKATAEETLEAYAEEFGRLVGGTDAVYGLDSVGGAYLFTAPEATTAIAEFVGEEYDEEAVGEVLREIIERSNEYLKDAQKRVEERVEGAKDVIDPDWANNHNRKYKAPLAIHKDHDAVVTPIDTDDVDYSITRLDDVDDDLVAESEEWAERFTAEEHTDRVAQLVDNLFDDDADTWHEAIDQFVETRREQRQKREELRKQSRRVERDRDLDLSEFDITPSISEVEDVIDGLEIEEVADEFIVQHWTEDKTDLTDRSGSNKKSIVPTWAGSYNSGNATYVDLNKGIFNDTADENHGTAVEMALIDAESWPVGKIAGGRDWSRGVQYLREAGFEIPVWTPDAKNVESDTMPYWALRSAAIALGVLDEDDLVERDSETGEVVEDADEADDTYRAFPPGVYDEAVAAVEDAGLVTGRDPVGAPDTNDNPEPPEEGDGGDTEDEDADDVGGKAVRFNPDTVVAYAGLGEDATVSDLDDRQRAAVVWDMIFESDEFHIRVRTDNDSLWRYDNGVWTNDGERRLKHAARRSLGSMNYGANVFNEMKAQARSDPRVLIEPDDFGVDEGYVAAENGLLDLRAAADGEGEDAIRKLVPEDYAMTRLPVHYNPGETAPEWEELVDEWSETGRTKALQEYVGYCLHTGGMPIHRALLLVGSGANGKGTFLGVVRELLGDENTTSTELQTLANENDAVADFHGSIANIDDDLSARQIGNGLGMFKKLVGGDRVRARHLYQDAFEFQATGKHLYAANEVPEVSVPDDDEAFWRRWLLVEFPNHYPPSERDTELTSRLTTPPALSGVLNWAIEGWARLLDNGKFTGEEEYAHEKRLRWQRWGESIDQFIGECVKRDEDAERKSTSEVHARFLAWCEQEGQDRESQQALTNKLKNETVGYTNSIRIGKKVTRGYTALAFTDDVPEADGAK